MNPFKKILVPHDFSPHAKNALEFAVDLAKKYDASLSLVHVHEPVLYALPDSFILYPSEQMTAMLGAFQQQLDAIQEKLRAAGLTRVENKVLQGIPVSELVRYAKEGNFDLIVMGTHGRTGLSHAVIGSVAERVVRKAACPVLTVHLPSA
jgi:nucleotide-binding universal stress UspA family protein